MKGRGRAGTAARGYFEIGVWHPKTENNIGTLWRSAHQLGAAGIFAIAPRWPKRQSSDTAKAWRHIPYRLYPSFTELAGSRPFRCHLVAVEEGGISLTEFAHPDRCYYLLGAEDYGLPLSVIKACGDTVSIPAVRQPCYNVATAGALVMWDRFVKGLPPQ